MRLMFALPGLQEWWRENRTGFAQDFAAYLESAPGLASSADVGSDPAAFYGDDPVKPSDSSQ
jgi:hypothetical protein